MSYIETPLDILLENNKYDDLVLSEYMNMVNESHLMINPHKVKEGDSGFYLDGTYYSIRWIDKKPYRDRVETLIVKDRNKVYLRLLQDNSQFQYTIPGGGLDLDSSPIIQAENEINEEALISVKNMSATGITFVNVYKDDSRSKFRHIKNFPIRYKGAFTELFIAEYDGKFTGHVDEKDLDNKMANEGKFISIQEVLPLLMDKHKDALINSNLIDDTTRNLLLSSYKSNVICTESTSIDVYNEKMNSLFIEIPQNNDDLESNIYNHKVRFMEIEKFIIESKNNDNIDTNDLYKLFILHINKQISSVRFTYKSDHDELNKKLWLEFDKWLSKLKDKVNNNIILENTVTTHSIEALKPKLYHISESNLDNKVLIPTKPDNYMTRNGIQENTMMYVSFNQFIDKALLEMSSTNLNGKTFFVHEPINYPKSITNPTELIPTLEQSNELWVTNPVKVRTIGKLKFMDSSQWEWIDTPLGETYLSESLNIVMEADPLDEEDEPTDYTQDDEPDEDLNEEEPTDYTNSEDDEPTDEDNIEDVDIEEEPTDYTDTETDEEPLDNEDEIVDETGDDDIGTDEDIPTDYTDDEGTEPTDEPGGEDENTTTDEEPTEEETETNDGSVVKNKFLLKDFSRLYEMVDDIINNLETTVYINPIQNSGLSQVIKNMKKIKDFTVDYIENNFKVDDYTSNLYYYNIAIQSLKINYKMLEKIQELDSNNKQIDKNKS